MVYGCGNTCIKILVWTFNFLAFVVGVAVMVAGIVGLTVPDFTKFLNDLIKNDELNSNFRTVFILAAIVGGIAMLLGFLGCCGAWCENTCLLGTFAVFMGLLAIVQVGGGIYGLVTKNGFQKLIDEGLKKSIDSVKNGDASAKTSFCQSWSSMENDLKCCSCDGCDNTFLDTCNQYKPNPLRTCKQTGNSDPYCDTAINEQMAKYVGIVAGVAIGLVAIEILAVIFSCCLCSAIRRGGYHK
jgi:CD63 antigen